jgi:uncharacterized membrane protein
MKFRLVFNLVFGVIWLLIAARFAYSACVGESLTGSAVVCATIGAMAVALLFFQEAAA